MSDCVELEPGTTAIQQVPHTTHNHLGGAGNQLSRRRCDVISQERPRDAGATTSTAEEVFYVTPDSMAAHDRRGDEPQRINSMRDQRGHAFICTTGTNLYRILALSDKLSTRRNSADCDDHDTPQRQDWTSGGPDEGKSSRRTTDYSTLSRHNLDRHRANGLASASVNWSADDFSQSWCLSGICQHGNDSHRQCDSDDIRDGCKMAAAWQYRPALPTSAPPPPGPPTSQLRRHCSTDGDVDDVGWRRPRSAARMSYRAYSSRVFRGAPKLVYFDDGGTTAACQQLPENNSSDVFYDKPICHSASSSGRICPDSGMAVHGSRSRSFNAHPTASRCEHRQPRVQQSPDHVDDRQRPVPARYCTGARADSLMMNWLRRTADDQARTTVRDDVISGHVIIGDDRSTGAATKKPSEAQWLTQDAGTNSLSADDAETISPRREITSGDVMAGATENKGDEKVYEPYDAAGVTAADRPKPLAGDTSSTSCISHTVHALHDCV